MAVERSAGHHLRMDDDHLIAPRALAARLAAADEAYIRSEHHRFGARPTRHRLIADLRARWPWLAA